MSENTQAPAEDLPEPPAHTFIALLDADGLYFGQRQVLVEDLSAMQGVVDLGPAGCDLQPGRYRWDLTSKHFVPLAPSGAPASAPLPVSALNALAWLVWDLHQGGHKHLPPVAAWFNEYAKTVDFGPQRVRVDRGNGLVSEQIAHLEIKGE